MTHPTSLGRIEYQHCTINHTARYLVVANGYQILSDHATRAEADAAADRPADEEGRWAHVEVLAPGASTTVTLWQPLWRERPAAEQEAQSAEMHRAFFGAANEREAL